MERYFSGEKYVKEQKYNNGDRYYNNGNITIGRNIIRNIIRGENNNWDIL